MKKFVAFVVAAAAVPALVGPGIAQTEKKAATPPAVTETEKKPAAAPAPARMEPTAREAAVKNLTGEIVSMDQTARTVTVKHMVDKKAAQVTFSVDDAAVLMPFKAGDHVKVTYAETGDKRIVKSIVKG
jgi:Cu/Ag efflux protein CusF